MNTELIAFAMLVLGILVGWAVTRLHVSREQQQSNEKSVAQLQSVLQERAQLQERTNQIPDLLARIQASEDARDQLARQLADMREQNGKLGVERAREEQLNQELSDQLRDLREELGTLRSGLSESDVLIAQLRVQLDAERQQVERNAATLEQTKVAMSHQFQALANEILEAKSAKFTEHNRSQVDQLLQPLKTQLKDFRDKVEYMHIKDVQQQATLNAELNQLKDLNRQLTEEAHGLATALRGQAKMQGNWGELVLENVLERSGLRINEDYRREVNFNTESGRKRPDVVVYLPQAKHLVIDAKVSLNAYARYINGETELEKAQALREHVSAVASRIKELSDKNYFELPGLNTPEVVFMFIPIESAFVEALRADETLFQRAIEQNILVATPTTLLTSLNIVRQLWRFEEQNKNTAALAERASKVYKKLNSFLQSMENIGAALDRAKAAFGTACGQLYSGKDNLVKQANDFRQLGVSVQAALPEQFVTRAELELEYFPDLDEERSTDTPIA